MYNKIYVKQRLVLRASSHIHTKIEQTSGNPKVFCFSELLASASAIFTFYAAKLIFFLYSCKFFLIFFLQTNHYLYELTSRQVDEFRMLRRYRKLQEDTPLLASKIEDDTLASWCSASKQMSFISLYLHLSSSIFMFE